MSLARWVLLTGFGVFALSAATTVLRAALSARPSDLAPGKGNSGRGVLYSLTAAMLPWKKESARRHLVVYALGVAYHAGIFLAFLWLPVLFFGWGSLGGGSPSLSEKIFAAGNPPSRLPSYDVRGSGVGAKANGVLEPERIPRPSAAVELPRGPYMSPAWPRGASALLLAVSALCGLVLLARRSAVANLRYFSSPDDYFANIAVTVFQVLTAAALVGWIGTTGLFIYAGLLLAYVPFGKLRHAIYFPLARVYLGRFYGRRGVWPAADDKSWQI